MKELDQVWASLDKDTSWIKDRTCFISFYGSHAHGLNTEQSDVDLRGITIPPTKYWTGFQKSFDELIRNDPDTVIFGIKKFFKLNYAGNPNCLELLFVEPEDRIYVNEFGKMLLEHREKFLSKQVKERYIGYAKSQAHRIKNHRSWLLNKMEAPPSRKDMGLPERPAIEKNQFDVIKALVVKKLEEWNPYYEPFSDSQKIYLQNKVSDILSEMEITKNDQWAAAARTIGLNENLITLIKKEKEWENKVEDWNNYLNWKKNRNPNRAEMEAKFGYDLKHATALVRLLKMGKEILDTGKVIVKRREDKEELMAIKNGAWTYEQLIEYADKVEASVVQSYKTSKLPNQPDVHFLDSLLMEIVERSCFTK